MSIQKKGVFIVLIFCLIAYGQSKPLLWPLPKSMNTNDSAVPIQVSPCEVKYIISSPLSPFIDNMIKFYL